MLRIDGGATELLRPPDRKVIVVAPYVTNASLSCRPRTLPLIQLLLAPAPATRLIWVQGISH